MSTPQEIAIECVEYTDHIKMTGIDILVPVFDNLRDRIAKAIQTERDKSYQVTVCKKHDPTHLHCAECSDELRSALRESVEVLSKISPYDLDRNRLVGSWDSIINILAKLKSMI